MSIHGHAAVKFKNLSKFVIDFYYLLNFCLRNEGAFTSVIASFFYSYKLIYKGYK